MSGNAQWLPGARRRAGQQQCQEQLQKSSYLTEQTLLWDAYESKHSDSRRNRLARNFLSVSKRNCGLCWSRMALSPRWLPTCVVLLAGVALTCGIWLSEDSSLAGLPWPWHNTIPGPAVTNAFLLVLAGIGFALLAHWRSDGRPLMLLQAKTVIFLFWLALNIFWLIAGIRERDFNKPSWLKQTRVPSRAQHFSEPVLRTLRLLYGVGMACTWPLLANLFVVLLPVDRTLFLLACLGAGHEEGVLAHAFCGTAVWVWASAHAVLTQAPMLAAGLWRMIVLPPLDGSESKATSNFMGLLAFLCMTALGVSSLARLRRLFFNWFQWLHVILAPAVLLFGCLHDSKIFWYSMLGAVLYGADLVQRIALRRRAAVATATVYPLQPAAPLAVVTSPSAGAGRTRVVEGLSSKFVVLRIETGCNPGCVAGQHVFIKVPAVSRWEWHPYSVAAYDGHSFAVVVKAGGDWERRLCRAVELAAATAGARSVRLNVAYEGLYGTPDLQAAAAAADRVLLFAGGAGITPVASVLQSLLAVPPPLLPPPCMAPEPAGNGWHGVTSGPNPALGTGNGLSGHPHVEARQGQVVSPTKQNVVGAPEYGVWAVAGEAATTAAAAAAGDVVAAAVRSGARVHLVWAVTRESDAQALMPLLCAAAARGWQVDLHCTRTPPAQVAMVANGGFLPVRSSRPLDVPSVSAGSAPAQTVGTAATPRAPWHLRGAACWAVAALAALLGAVGSNLGSVTASTHTCKVAGPAAIGDGSSSTSDWMAVVRSAFLPARHGAGLSSVDPDAASAAASPSLWGRLVGALLQGSADPSLFSCPLSVAPLKEHQRAAVAAGASAVMKKVAKAALRAESVSLRVCRSWGVEAPELCVKCDPLKDAKSELQRAWPCCQARVCFFAAHLAPLLGSVIGALLGAALACVVWRWWSAAAAASGRGAGRRRPLLAAQSAGGWFGVAARLGKSSAGGGGKEVSEAAAGLLPGAGADGGPAACETDVDGVEAAERGGEGSIGVTSGPGLEAMVPASLAVSCEHMAEGLSGAGICVHAGRPDVEVYIRAAAASGDAPGCGRYGREAYGNEVYGVVVCGPESLQAAVQTAYERHLSKKYPESWFRGFSFTT